MTSATLDREFWCLWASNGHEWHLLDEDVDPAARQKLEQKAEGLRMLFANRKFAVALGPDKPGSKRT